MNGIGYIPGEAPGAIANGTRIRKCAGEVGDATGIGELGTVIASHAITAEMLAELRKQDTLTREARFAYWVNWDYMPGLPVFVTDWKIEVAS